MDARLYAEDDDAGLARRASSRRGRARHRQSAHRGHQQIRQRQGAARSGAGGGAARCRLYVQPHPMAAPQRQNRRGRALDARRAARSGTAGRSRSMVGRTAADGAQAARSRRRQDRPTQVANGAAPPPNENYRAEQQFTAGWIALRFLHEPAIALAHFARIAEGVANPITLARSFYWQGRAAEALGREQEARAHYEDAARYPTAYYGQLARARLGIEAVTLRTAAGAEPPSTGSSKSRARLEILYAIDERDIAAVMAADLADKANRPRRAGDARRNRRAPQRRARDAAHRQDRARPRLAARALRVSRFRRAELSADRAGGRALRRLFDRAPGKRLQSRKSSPAPTPSA